TLRTAEPRPRHFWHVAVGHLWRLKASRNASALGEKRISRRESCPTLPITLPPCASQQQVVMSPLASTAKPISNSLQFPMREGKRLVVPSQSSSASQRNDSHGSGVKTS